MYTQIDSKIIIKYLIALKEKSGLTYEAIAEASGIPESTIKKLFSGKVENPGLDTILPVMYVLGGSFEEITGKNKAGVGYAILIGLLILEVSNPNLGWLRF